VKWARGINSAPLLGAFYARALTSEQPPRDRNQAQGSEAKQPAFGWFVSMPGGELS